MVYGAGGNSGVAGNVYSASCRMEEAAASPNPCLSAIIKSVSYVYPAAIGATFPLSPYFPLRSFDSPRAPNLAATSEHGAEKGGIPEVS